MLEKSPMFTQNKKKHIKRLKKQKIDFGSFTEKPAWSDLI